MKWKLVQDTRETNGWFPEHIEVIREYLPEGDYTSNFIMGYERAVGQRIFRIERKASPSELALTLGRNWKNFTAEMERLRDYDMVVLLFEFSREDMLRFPAGSHLPKHLRRKVRVTGKVMNAKLEQIIEEYNPRVIFSNGREEAMNKAISLIEEVHKKWMIV